MSWVVQNVKLLSLGCLVAQNCALVLMMRHSLTDEGSHYISSTAVAIMEVSGCAISQRLMHIPKSCPL